MTTNAIANHLVLILVHRH